MDDFDIVAAIDFGTALSGCAYSTRKNYNDDKLSINCEQYWNKADSMNQDIVKTASCILLHRTHGLIAFGFDAEFKYAQLKFSNEDGKYLFFHYFKMSLYSSKVI